MTSASVSHLLAPMRAGEWWEHKLAPMLGTGYMTAFLIGVSLLRLWPAWVAVLLGAAAAAAYVSLINDATDLEEDAAAGKYNRLAERPGRYAPTAIAACLAAGVAVAIIAWRDDPLALALYAGGWLAFSLYSIPPVRLKARGWAGVLADGSGAHLFPAALIAVAVFHRAGRPLDGPWMAAIAVWALALGIRGALWHQLKDFGVDGRSGIRTFGRLHPLRARYLGRGAFAIELLAFAYLLWRAGSPVAYALVVPYLLLEVARVRLWDVRLVVVGQAPLYRIVMHEYYLVMYPLVFLIGSAVRHPQDVVVLVVHVALFRAPLVQMARDTGRALRGLAVIRRTAAAPQGRSRS